MKNKPPKRQFFDSKYISNEKRQSTLLLCILIWSIIVYLICSQWVLGSISIDGNSMSPTLAHGDFYIFHRWVYKIKKPKRGDVVVIKDPNDGIISIKRVIGLPDEIIQFKNSSVYINAHKLKEPHLGVGQVTSPGRLTSKQYKIAPNAYFVLGDNRNESYDSRDIGAISQHYVLGKINHATEEDWITNSLDAQK
ncbi:MAG: signal peptidase I [Candidatus Omnitrophota bacterium]